MTMNTSWGYKYYDDNWKSSETLIRMLVDIASKGGNLLLNVGPTAEGLIPGPSVERLKKIGEWMDINKESIYRTDASPFFKLPWGRCTQRKTKKGTTLYLHVFDWPKDQVLRVPGLQASIRKAYSLTDKKQKLSYKFDNGDLLVDLPNEIPDAVNTVIAVETKGMPEVTSNMPALKDGEILLSADFANIHNRGYGTHAILSGTGDKSVITNWIDPRTRLEWMFNSTASGTYDIEALVRSDGSASMTVKIGENTVEAEIQSTQGEFSNLILGRMEISDTGDLILEVSPVPEQWQNVELAKIELIRK
jgi:alpha-L-fucosidase